MELLMYIVLLQHTSNADWVLVYSIVMFDFICIWLWEFLAWNAKENFKVIKVDEDLIKIQYFFNN